MDQVASTQAVEVPAAPESWTKRLGTDAVLLAVLSGLGYWIAFAYESGYASHFGYPTFLISPSLTAIVVAFGALAGAMMAASPLLMDLFRIGDAGTRVLAYRLILVGLFGLAAAQVYIASNYSWVALWRLAPGIAMYFLVQWASNLQNRGGSAANPKAALGLFAVLVAMILHFISSFLGLMAAKDQKVFYFLSGKADYAIVRVYDGMTIAVRFDSQKNSFTGEYFVAKLGEEPKELGLKRVALTAPRLPVLKSGEP